MIVSKRPGEVNVMLWRLVFVFAITLAQASYGGARQEALVTLPEDAQQRKAREALEYADAVLHGDTAYLSGVVAVLQEGESTPELAYERVFKLIAERLSKVGCTWDDVVELTSYHTDLVSQVPFMVAVKRKYVRPPYLAWTAIGVSRLIPNNGVTEIRVIARACDRSRALRDSSS